MSQPEYVSVYETLGAKIDALEKQLEDKNAEIAILVSRTLAAEAKLNIGKTGHGFVPFDNIPERCKFCGNSKESHKKKTSMKTFRAGSLDPNEDVYLYEDVKKLESQLSALQGGWVEVTPETRPPMGLLVLVSAGPIVQTCLYSWNAEDNIWSPFDEDFDCAPLETFTHYQRLPPPPATRSKP